MTMPLHQQGTLVDVETVAARVAAELSTLQVLSDDLQAALEFKTTTGHAASDVDADLIVALQNLDLVTQTLGALKSFMSALACDPGIGGAVDIAKALRNVTLAALADRLAGNASAASEDFEFELF